ncbi:MAG: site-specific integrase [Bacteroidales bacterium]|nr:site-specific integrase [Bacteroidales bacterium]
MEKTTKTKLRPSEGKARPDGSPNADTRVTRQKNRRQRSNTLFRYMDDVIQRFLQLNRIGTAKNYQSTLCSVRRFRNGKDIPFGKINSNFIEDYEAWLHTLDLSPNTTSFYMRNLRAVYNRAVNQGLTKDAKPFSTVFTGMEKTRKRAVTISDIRRIKDLNLKAWPNLEFARDIFMFLFYCRGMSFIDAAFLKKTDISEGILHYRRHKTNQPLNIRMVNEMTEIINRYDQGDSPYLLPIISKEFIDGRNQYYAAIHRVNKALKQVGLMAGLPIPLSTYVSRHSWATIAKTKNIPLTVISEALGHDSESTTQIYLASIDHSVIDMANNSILGEL